MFQIVGVGEPFILLHYDVSGPDNLSAADGAKAWDLRCEIREKLVFFVQRHYPKSASRKVWDARQYRYIGEADAPVSVLSYS